MRQTCSKLEKVYSTLHRSITTKASFKMERGTEAVSWFNNQATFMKDNGQMVRKMEEESIMMLRSNSVMKESGRMGKNKDSDTYILTITALTKGLFLKIISKGKASKNCIMEIHSKGSTRKAGFMVKEFTFGHQVIVTKVSFTKDVSMVKGNGLLS